MHHHRSFAVWLAVIGVAACSSGGSSLTGSPTGGGAATPNSDGGALESDADTDAGDGLGPLPFSADPPSVYVAKVKDVLVGLPTTDDEIATVTKDPSQLGALVDTWMTGPSFQPLYQLKMRRFFELAFQQTQIATTDFDDQVSKAKLRLDPNQNTEALSLQNQEELFARTMLDPSMSAQPFTTAMTTQTFALTSALRLFYALMDAWQIDDDGNVTDAFANANPKLNISITATGAPIALSDSVDPTNANYMHFYDPAIAGIGGGPTCQTDPISYPARSNTLFDILHGVYEARTVKGTQCPGLNPSSATTAFMSPADFSDWSMVSVRAPKPGEATTTFYDLPTLRGAKELVLAMPRIGFFSTPAFFANWQTNASNEMRVTVNQTLIVATGAQIDGSDSTTPTSTPGLDSVHAGNPDCFSCHQLLDPTRSILAATYSWNYHTQIDPTFTGQPGLFAFEGVQAPIKTINDFANTLASHPFVASGWAEKLCYYIDSESCESTDPAFQDIVAAFTASNYSWNALVKAVVTSPITTHAAPTLTATTDGEAVAVARRDHICAAWNARLQMADVCGLDATLPNVLPKSVLSIVGGLPSDGYGRGSTAPVLPNQPSLFFRAGTENLCEALAATLIDNKKAPDGALTWSSADPNAALADFVSIVMGLPSSDPRASAALGVLTSHFAAAKAQTGVTASDALRSTFTIACLAPTAVSMGL